MHDHGPSARRTARQDRARVVVAGAGVAALEILAGLARIAGDAIELTLIAPDATFAYRAASTARPFALLPERQLALEDVARDHGARLLRDAAAFVDDRAQRLLTRDGDTIEFDALAVATGARWSWPVRQGLLWGRGSEGESEFAALLREVEAGTAGRLAFIVPRGACWPVDAYELALIAAAAGRSGPGSPKITVVTAERRPLELLGDAASAAVAKELRLAGIRVEAGVAARDPRSDNASLHEPGSDALSALVARTRRHDDGPHPQPPTVTLELGTGRSLHFDRVVCVPAAAGPRIQGLPHARDRLIPVDAGGRVAGCARVWAAGDCTSLAVKHALLAARQADAVVAGIAASVGIADEPDLSEPRLHGVMAAPATALANSVWAHDGEPMLHCLWWPPVRATGGEVSHYIARRDHTIHAGLEWHPHGVPIDVPVPGLAGANGEASSAEFQGDARALERDALARELLAVRRLESEGDRTARRLEHGLEELEGRHRAVVAELESAGYLRHV